MKQNHKGITAALLFVIVMLSAYGAYQYLKPSIQTDTIAKTNGNIEEKKTHPAVDVTIEKDGEELTLSSLYGKPVVLNFWASWCPQCVEEMPFFEKAYQTYGEEIQFVMLNMTKSSKETKEAADALIAEAGYTFPVYYDTLGEAMNRYQVYALPMSYIIDAEGNIVGYAHGAVDEQSLQKGIDLVLCE